MGSDRQSPFYPPWTMILFYGRFPNGRLPLHHAILCSGVFSPKPFSCRVLKVSASSGMQIFTSSSRQNPLPANTVLEYLKVNLPEMLQTCAHSQLDHDICKQPRNTASFRDVTSTERVLSYLWKLGYTVIPEPRGTSGELCGILSRTPDRLRREPRAKVSQPTCSFVFEKGDPLLNAIVS